MELDQFNEPYPVRISGLESARKTLLVNLKVQLEECGLELDQMREEQAAQLEISNQNRALYKNKLAEERKRTAFL